jgi:hypothetical protein
MHEAGVLLAHLVFKAVKYDRSWWDTNILDGSLKGVINRRVFVGHFNIHAISLSYRLPVLLRAQRNGTVSGFSNR